MAEKNNQKNAENSISEKNLTKKAQTRRKSGPKTNVSKVSKTGLTIKSVSPIASSPLVKDNTSANNVKETVVEKVSLAAENKKPEEAISKAKPEKTEATKTKRTPAKKRTTSANKTAKAKVDNNSKPVKAGENKNNQKANVAPKTKIETISDELGTVPGGQLPDLKQETSMDDLLNGLLNEAPNVKVASKNTPSVSDNKVNSSNAQTKKEPVKPVTSKKAVTPVKAENQSKAIVTEASQELIKDAVQHMTLDLKVYGGSLENAIINDDMFYRRVLGLVIPKATKESKNAYSRNKIVTVTLDLVKKSILKPYKVGTKTILLEPENAVEVTGKVIFQDDSEKIGREVIHNYCVKVELSDGTVYPLHVENEKIFHGDLISGILNKVNDVVYYQKTDTEHNRVLGRLMARMNGFILSPDDPRFGNCDFIFDKNTDVGAAQMGSIVICDIVKRRANKHFSVRVADILGDLSRLDVQIQMAISRNGIPNEWSSKVKNQVQAIPEEVPEKDKQNRRDVRDLPLVTIDGEDARDFDDAVCCKKEGDGFRLWVAIADVSYYVRPGTPLDHEAKHRGNSVYFPNYVVPMLPEKLSNGLCSLNPHVDRLCFVCEVLVKHSGELGNFSFYPAVMRSHARLTYTEVASILAGNKPSSSEFEPLVNDIKNLYELYKVLKEARTKRGAVEFESSEVRFVFDDNLNLSNLVPVVRNDAHMLIEECMIAANVCAARFVESAKGHTMYRVHSKPSTMKLAAFREFIAPFGYTLNGGDEPEPKDYAEFARLIEDSPNKKVLSTMMLRSMSLAQYSPVNEGHFGLALAHYAHFTSPIRRYPDLQFHREIKYLLGQTGACSQKLANDLGAKSYLDDELEVLAENCNDTERRADFVTGQVAQVLKAKFMEQFIGKVLPGVVSNVTNFGLFVTIERFQIDGLVYVANIGDEYYSFDPSTSRLLGESSGRVYQLGQSVNVRIKDVDVESGHVNMVLENISKKKKVATNIENLDNFVPTGTAVANESINKTVRESLKTWSSKENPEDEEELGTIETKKEKVLESYKPKAALKKKTEKSVSSDKAKTKSKAKASKKTSSSESHANDEKVVAKEQESKKVPTSEQVIKLESDNLDVMHKLEKALKKKLKLIDKYNKIQEKIERLEKELNKKNSDSQK